MNVTCPECGTTYRVDPDKVPASGVFARCARCPGEFAIAVPAGEDVTGSAASLDPSAIGTEVAEAGVVGETWSVQGMDETTWARPGSEEESSGIEADVSYGDAGDELAYTEADTETETEPGSSEGYGDNGGAAAVPQFDAPPPEPALETDSWDASLGYVQEEIVSDVSPPVVPADEYGVQHDEEPGYQTEADGATGAAEAVEPVSVEAHEEAVRHEDRPDLTESDLAAGGPLPEAPHMDERYGYDSGVDLESDAAYHPAAAVEPDDVVGEAHEGYDDALPGMEGVDGGAAAEEVESSIEPPPPLPEEEALSAGFAATPVRPTSEDELPPPPFGFSDPHARARRLARALVSDIVVYHPDRRERSLRDGTLRQEFREEIRKSWDEYVTHVGEQFARDTTYFRDALNELLAGGSRLF